MLSSHRSEVEPRRVTPSKVEPDFHGASLVLENGIEIPITEAMVRACLEQVIKEQARSKSSYLG